MVQRRALCRVPGRNLRENQRSFFNSRGIPCGFPRESFQFTTRIACGIPCKTLHEISRGIS